MSEKQHSAKFSPERFEEKLYWLISQLSATHWQLWQLILQQSIVRWLGTAQHTQVGHCAFGQTVHLCALCCWTSLCYKSKMILQCFLFCIWSFIGRQYIILFISYMQELCIPCCGLFFRLLLQCFFEKNA